jgi:uncharacterized protein YjbI with pentapeptide repeats
MRSVNLRGADLSEASIWGANMIRAKMNEISASNMFFSGSDLYRANLDGARLYGVDFSGSRLDQAQMANVQFAGVTFGGAYLLGTNLDKSPLSSDLISPDAEYTFLADISGVRYDSSTKWPEGFEPPANAVQIGGD